MVKSKQDKSERVAPDPTADPRLAVQALLDNTSDQKQQQFYQHVLDTFDFQGHTEIQAKHLAKRTREGGLKWFDLAHYLKLRYEYVVELGLDQGPPLQILDIGCGPGHFGYVCQYFGHEFTGLDVPDADIYTDLTQLFGVKRIVEAVQPATPLPPTPKVDLVTAFHALFFRKKGKQLFTLAEWQFFMEDLITNHVKERGKIHFLLDNPQKCDGLHVTDQEFIDFMVAHEGEVHGRNVIFKDVSQCPTIWLDPVKLVNSGNAEAIADGIRVMVEVGRIQPAANLAIESRDILLHSRNPLFIRAGIRALLEAGESNAAYNLTRKAQDALCDPRLESILKIVRSYRTKSQPLEGTDSPAS